MAEDVCAKSEGTEGISTAIGRRLSPGLGCIRGADSSSIDPVNMIDLLLCCCCAEREREEKDNNNKMNKDETW